MVAAATCHQLGEEGKPLGVGVGTRKAQESASRKVGHRLDGRRAGPATRNTVSTARRRSDWTASIPVSGSSRAVSAVMPLAASSVSATARVPLPSGPTASRRPRRVFRSVGPGAPRKKTHKGSRYRLASERSDSVAALHEGDVDAAVGVFEQPDVLDGARRRPYLEGDVLVGEPRSITLGELVVGTVGAAGGDHDATG